MGIDATGGALSEIIREFISLEDKKVSINTEEIEKQLDDSRNKIKALGFVEIESHIDPWYFFSNPFAKGKKDFTKIYLSWNDVNNPGKYVLQIAQIIKEKFLKEVRQFKFPDQDEYARRAESFVIYLNQGADFKKMQSEFSSNGFIFDYAKDYTMPSGKKFSASQLRAIELAALINLSLGRRPDLGNNNFRQVKDEIPSVEQTLSINNPQTANTITSGIPSNKTLILTDKNGFQVKMNIPTQIGRSLFRSNDESKFMGDPQFYIKKTTNGFWSISPGTGNNLTALNNVILTSEQILKNEDTIAVTNKDLTKKIMILSVS